MRRVFAGVLLLLALVTALLVWWRSVELPGSGPPPPQRSDAAAPASATALQGSPDGAATSSGPQRDAVDVAEPEPLLHGRVTGLLFGVPWTGAIQLELAGNDTKRGRRQDHRERFVPAADGTFTLQLPAWVATSTGITATFAGDEPRYRSIDYRDSAASLAQSRFAQSVTLLPTEVRALVRGTVVHPTRGRVPAANVIAYLLRDGRPSLPRLAVTSTNRRGDFELQTDTAGDLLLVAVEMTEARLGSHPLTSRNGAIATTDSRVPERQPAAVVCTAGLGAINDAPPLVLADSARLDVAVQGADGGPATAARVWFTYAADVPLDYGIAWWRDGSCGAPSGGRTDAEGRAVLLGAAGRRGRVGVDCIGTVERDAQAPGTLRIVLPAAANR
jgi:hypothetical protein